MNMAEEHIHQVSEECDIPALCRKTFLSIDAMVKSLWIVAIVIVIPSSVTGLTWAINTNKAVESMQAKIITDEIRLDKLDREINQKLDILIQRGK
jgi:cell division protein FtsL